MNSSRSIICSEHRLARFVAWARLALAWIAMMLLSDETPRARRRIVRRRYCLLDLGVMTRLVRNLVIIRAAQLSKRRRRRSNVLDTAPAGFTRRTCTHAAALRRTAGSWLRRSLAGEGGAALRISRLLAALAELDTLARRLVREPRRACAVRCGFLLSFGRVSLPRRRDEHAFAAGARARLRPASTGSA